MSDDSIFQTSNRLIFIYNEISRQDIERRIELLDVLFTAMTYG